MDHYIGLRNGFCDYSSWNSNPSSLQFQTVYSQSSWELYVADKLLLCKPQRPYKNWLHVLKFTVWASFCFQMNLTHLALNLRVGKYEPQTHNSQVFVEILERAKNACAKWTHVLFVNRWTLAIKTSLTPMTHKHNENRQKGKETVSQRHAIQYGSH